MFKNSLFMSLKLRATQLLGATGSSLASRLVGVWTLRSFVDEQAENEDVHPFGVSPTGFLIYTTDGFVSAQLMRPGRAAFHSPDWHHATAEEYRESGSGYIAYCGTYEVDAAKATVTHTPSVALLPNLVDEPQCRAIAFEGARLILRTAGAPIAGGRNVTTRLEWTKVTPAAWSASSGE
jgi:Lipocalin-like domain